MQSLDPGSPADCSTKSPVIGPFAASLALFLLAICSSSAGAQSPINPNLIWFDEAATTWIEALPLGNGSLGAMVFGGVTEDRIQLNEDTIWGGSPDESYRRGSSEDLARVRQQLSRGEHAKVSAEIMGLFSAGSIKRSHQTVGDLKLKFQGLGGEVKDYRRELDISQGVARTTFSCDGHLETRTVFSSFPHQVIVVHLESEQKLGLRFEASLSRPQDEGQDTVIFKQGRRRRSRANTLVMVGQATNLKETAHGNGKTGVRFACEMQIETVGGSVKTNEKSITVVGARSATIWIAVTSDFENPWPQARRRGPPSSSSSLPVLEDRRVPRSAALAKARLAGRLAVQNRHVRDHANLFDRVGLDLGGPSRAQTPTDERLAAVKRGERDPGLSALLFQFGRYLMIASSRPGSQPANLQGLWNQHIYAPWNADYHLNINIQMNYWPVDVTNLSECAEPFFDYVAKLAKRGELRARENFGCAGWVTGHASDIWAPAFTRAERAYWGFSHLAAAWLMTHFVEHGRYQSNDVFLRKNAWPLLCGQAEFLLDWLVEDAETKKLVSGPATSPENSFRTPDGKSASVCMGPAFDQQVAAEFFEGMLEVADNLGYDNDLTRRVRGAQAQLKNGIVVGEDGRILEWDRPRPEVEKGHRHMSHLFALHPGHGIDPFRTPKLAVAARKTIDYRLQHGGAGTGWSRAWMISFMARLHDGEAAHSHLQALLKRSISTNLFDQHPPFQIDGNFGATAGIAEMLLQSDQGVIELLSALPLAWIRGSFRGLRAPGGFEIDAHWDGGRLMGANIHAHRQGLLRIRALKSWRIRGPECPSGGVENDGDVLEVHVRPGMSYRIEVIIGP